MVAISGFGMAIVLLVGVFRSLLHRLHHVSDPWTEYQYVFKFSIFLNIC